MTSAPPKSVVRVINLPTVRDQRGSLTPITFAEWGFEAVRSFVVTAPPGAVRGGHAHRACRQVLLRVSGIIDVHVRRGTAFQTIRLDGDPAAILIEPGVWAQQTYVTEGSALVVFADNPYDPDDYVEGDLRIAEPAVQAGVPHP